MLRVGGRLGLMVIWRSGVGRVWCGVESGDNVINCSGVEGCDRLGFT
jgi:hypothetical protein